MKNKCLLVSIIFILLVSMLQFATLAYTTLSYPDWYYEKFGSYPTEGASEWKNDPVYSEYLNEIGETGYNNDVDGRVDPVPPPPSPSYDERYYPTISDTWWSGKTARWDIEGYASKYQVTLYRDGNKVTTRTTTSRSYSFASYMARGDNEYYFDVRAYNRYTNYWSNWETSETQYVSHSDPITPITPVTPVTPTPGPGTIIVPGTNPPETNNATGQWVCLNNIWYYKFYNGLFASNTWLNLNGKWYYFNQDCSMAVGWLTYNGKQYFLNPDGSMLTGTVIFDGITHFFGDDGVMVY